MTTEQFHFQQVDYALDIYAGEQLVARLGLEGDAEQYNLQYAKSWVRSPDGYPLSPHLPLDGAANSHTIRRFLENLLPEGRALDVASVYTNIQKNNVFGLVRHLGKETTGGLTYLPAGQTPKVLIPTAREISFPELQERIDQRNQIPFTVWDSKVRMSVAGFQDKLLVHQHLGRFFLADGSLSSTHILKPEPLYTALPCMVANEHFCMTLAARISQQRYKQSHVAQVELLRVPSPVLSIRRFDRKARRQTQEVAVLSPDGRSNGRNMNLDLMHRQHTIDGCQASDLSVGAKYERNMGNGKDVAHIRDGASFQKIFAVKAHLETPAVGVQRLVLWATTTLLFGNSNAHGKNISFHVGRAGLNVAELYDLVSVMQYDREKLEHSLAMAFGDEFELAQVKSFALADFCERCSISRSFFARELVNLCNSAIEQAPLQTQEDIYVGEERNVVASIADYVVERAEILKAMARDVTRYKREIF